MAHWHTAILPVDFDSTRLARSRSWRIAARAAHSNMFECAQATRQRAPTQHAKTSVASVAHFHSAMMMLRTILLAAIAASAAAFAPANQPAGLCRSASTLRMASDDAASDSSKFELMTRLPPSTSILQAQLAFPSVVDGPSEIVEVRYNLPFGLDVAPRKGTCSLHKVQRRGRTAGRHSSILFAVDDGIAPRRWIDHDGCLLLGRCGLAMLAVRCCQGIVVGRCRWGSDF